MVGALDSYAYWGNQRSAQIADFAFTYLGSSTMPRAEKYLDLVVKALLPASFRAVSRATKEYRALDHGNAKFSCKGRWEGWARLFAFPMILCEEPKSLQSLLITNSLENRPFYRVGGHIELIRFKEYYGMPRGEWARSDILAQYLRALSWPIFL